MENVITFAAAIFTAVALLLVVYWSYSGLRASRQKTPHSTQSSSRQKTAQSSSRNSPNRSSTRNAQRRLSPKARTIIADIEKSLRGLPYEAMYIVDGNGGIIYSQTQYDTKTVEFTDEQMEHLAAHPGSISIHNHDTDTPPSVTDLSFAARTKQSRLIVVSPNYTYIVAPPADGWKSDDELDALCRKHMHLFNIINRSERFAGFDRDGAILMLSEVEYETTDKAMAVIAAKLGYHYVRENA